MIIACRNLLMVGAITALSMAKSQSQNQQPPNVVFIIVDQMRGDAMSLVGSPNVRTPHLDDLASRGVLFNNFYVNNPVCAPSRMSFFSGLYPHQHGKMANMKGKFRGELLDKIDGTLLGYFRNKGYQLGWVGKNHTFEKNVADDIGNKHMRSREKFRAYSKYVPPHWHSDMFWEKTESYAHINSADAVEFIGAVDRTKPFFLHISYFDPHPPYMAPAEYTSRYSSAQMVLPPFVEPAALSPRLDEEYRAKYLDRLTDADFTETMRYYYAAIEYGVDQQVGKIMDALEINGFLDNTIVVFTSDHGDFMAHHGMVRKGMYLYDDLLHVPFIIYAPGAYRKGKVVDNLSQGIDLFPTLIDLTGGSPRSDLPGRSLKPILEKPVIDPGDFAIYASAAYSDLPKDYFAHPQPYFAPESEVPLHTRIERLTWVPEHKTVMVRTKDWKLIKSETRPSELYRMTMGRGETENVYDKKENTKIIKLLTEKIKELDGW